MLVEPKYPRIILSTSPPSSRAPPYYVGPKAVTSLMSTVARPRWGQGTTSPLLATSTANAGCKESTASSPKWSADVTREMRHAWRIRRAGCRKRWRACRWWPRRKHLASRGARRIWRAWRACWQLFRKRTKQSTLCISYSPSCIPDLEVKKGCSRVVVNEDLGTKLGVGGGKHGGWQRGWLPARKSPEDSLQPSSYSSQSLHPPSAWPNMPLVDLVAPTISCSGNKRHNHCWKSFGRHSMGGRDCGARDNSNILIPYSSTAPLPPAVVRRPSGGLGCGSREGNPSSILPQGFASQLTKTRNISGSAVLAFDNGGGGGSPPHHHQPTMRWVSTPQRTQSSGPDATRTSSVMMPRSRRERRWELSVSGITHWPTRREEDREEWERRNGSHRHVGPTIIFNFSSQVVAYTWIPLIHFYLSSIAP